MQITPWILVIVLLGISIIYFPLGKRWKVQNIILLLASYGIYALWDWRFLTILIGITLLNYVAGFEIGIPSSSNLDHQVKKRVWLGIAIVINLGALLFFKYFNFFDDSFISLLNTFGIHVSKTIISIILPLGLSYYTFMALTYPFDIFRGKLVPTKRILDFALFVSFFPTIVSGPVERAANMLSQFQKERSFTSDDINNGIWLILWGIFQKMVIADNLGLIVDRVFNNYSQFYGLDILVAILAFTVQILADLSGYTDMARGIAQILGFNVLNNFNVPYIAITPSDFWSRWHISLSTWFRDYLYIPLGGNRKGKWRTNINLCVTMTLVGFWHGASWTFLLWGLWHGVLQVIYRSLGDHAQSTNRTFTDLKSFVDIVGRTIVILVLVCAGWVLFRSTSFNQMAYLFSHISLNNSPTTLGLVRGLIVYSLPIAIVQITQLKLRNYVIVSKLNPWVRGCVYGLIIIGIIMFSLRTVSRFIYQGF
jgi:alginate O-acetyltransferase complex protein AlgI